MSKHTPGPWFADKKCELSGWVSIYAMGEDQYPTLPFAACKHINEEANARLIAAAPELLEALQSLASADFGSGKWTESEERAALKARAAIAKATGEKHE